MFGGNLTHVKFRGPGSDQSAAYAGAPIPCRAASPDQCREAHERHGTCTLRLSTPQSVAVIGASTGRTASARRCWRNLRAGGFAGRDLCRSIRSTRARRRGRSTRSVADLPEAPDLAVICTPPATVPGLIAELGARGTQRRDRHHRRPGALRRRRRSLKQAMLDAARPHLLRILGPNCVGLLVPRHRPERQLRAHRRAAGRASPSSRSRARWSPRCSTGRSRAASASRTFVSLGEQRRRRLRRPARLPRAATPTRARSCSTSNRSARRASSCRRRAPRRATSR